MFNVSSAIPDDLLRYSRRALELDMQLLRESFGLASVLVNFLRQCTEYHVSLLDIHEQIARYAREAEPIEERVKKVANDFMHADWPNMLYLIGRVVSWYERLSKTRAWSQIRLVLGSTYPDQVKVYGSLVAKKAIGLSPRLTHAPLAKLLQSVSKVGLFEIIMQLTESPKIYQQDLSEYGQRGPILVWTGTIVDLAISIAIGLAITTITSGISIIVGVTASGAAPIAITVALFILSGLVRDYFERQVLSTQLDETLTEWIAKRIMEIVPRSPSQHKDTSTQPSNSLSLPKQPEMVQPRPPFHDVEYKITGSYGTYQPYKREVLHSGIDLAPTEGRKSAPIYPIGPGKVIEVGGTSNSGYGYYVRIEHRSSKGETIYSLYGHMKEKPSIDIGQIVDTDTVLGEMGSSGNSTGPHLHLGISKLRHPDSFDGVIPNEKTRQRMEEQFYNPEEILNGGGEFKFKPVSQWEDPLQVPNPTDERTPQWARVFA